MCGLEGGLSRDTRMTVVVFTLETRSGIQTVPRSSLRGPACTSRSVRTRRGQERLYRPLQWSGQILKPASVSSQAPPGRQTDKHTQTHSPAQPPRGTPEQGDEDSSKASPDPLLPPETTAFCSLGSWPTGQSPERGLCLRKGPSEP